MPRIVSRTMVGMSAYAWVVTSPATWTWPVVIRVSTATRLRGSCDRSASRIPSLIWSAILSGWPSVTDSDVNRRRATVLLTKLGSGPGCATPPCLQQRRPRSRRAQACCYQIPDGVGQVFLRLLRKNGLGAVGPQHRRGVGVGPED